MKKRILIIVGSVLAVLLLLAGLFFGYLALEQHKRAVAPGNSDDYAYASLAKHPANALTGKTILFLGSSVTDGAAAKSQSFVEWLVQVDGVNPIKEAKSGTTLVDNPSALAKLAFGNGDSYIKRLLALDTTVPVDAVVCQLSTNDATMKLPLGKISDGTELSSFDTQTVTGAMEYIIRYCRDTWHCPVVFYTGSYYESDAYSAMVTRLHELQEKWGIGVIDLYTDEAFNAIDAETYELYMFDKIHPTMAGYSLWWGPEMEKQLIDLMKED